MDTTDPAHDVFRTTILDFLNAYLKGQAAALQMLRTTPNRPHTRFTIRP